MALSEILFDLHWMKLIGHIRTCFVRRFATFSEGTKKLDMGFRWGRVRAEQGNGRGLISSPTRKPVKVERLKGMKDDTAVLECKVMFWKFEGDKNELHCSCQSQT